ncbi:MAG TPA: DUF642 domain-containing protein [Steroidobacteraceae bacterium]
MKSNCALGTLLSVASLGACAAAHANLLGNGSFEQGTHTNDGNNTETFIAGATSMPGWTTTGAFVSWIGDPNPFGLSAQDGKFFLDLTGYKAGAPFGGVTQTIATTAGQTYDLSFYLGSRTDIWGGPPVSITASAGGTSALFTDNAHHDTSTWTLENLLFTAGAGSSTVITLAGAAGVNYIGLDNVDVECTSADGCSGGGGGGTSVPEPATLTLFGLGMAALGIARRRRITS